MDIPISLVIWSLFLVGATWWVVYQYAHDSGYAEGRKDEKIWLSLSPEERDTITRREEAQRAHQEALNDQYTADIRAHYERTGDTDPIDFPPRRNTLGPRPV